VLERSYSSTAISRVENYLLIVPDVGIPITGVVYFLHGVGGDRHFIQQIGACAEMDRLAAINGKSFMIAAPDGGIGYWMNAAHTPDRYLDLVSQELITQVETEFPNLPHAQSARVIAGVSMGGHGAIEISMHAPGIYGAIGAHSPVFRTDAEATAGGYFPQFGTGADYESHDPISMIQNLHESFTGPVYMDMGAEDPWLTRTLQFETLVQSLKVPGIFKVGADPGEHENAYWQSQLPVYMDWYFEQLSR
jgi:S-formylglutathione hydrolase FrmB